MARRSPSRRSPSPGYASPVIQVCSQCGTRWNVRDRQREWCPRCRGALMAPLADAPPPPDPRWSSRGGPPAAAPAPVPRPPVFPRTPPRLPPGFRWIAVRPGAAPPARRRRRHLGPTPRYAVIPRWGLVDRVEQAPETRQAPVTRGPSAATVRTTLFMTVLVLAITALVYVLRYVLLVVNRNTLLNSVVAGAADWLGVAASVAAILALIGCVAVLIRWLIARRAAAFSHYARQSAAPRGRCGPAPGAVRQSAVGSGLRHRAGSHRKSLHPATATDHAVVDRVDFQLHRFDFRVHFQLRHRFRRASPTTPSPWCSPTCLRPSPSRP